MCIYDRYAGISILRSNGTIGNEHMTLLNKEFGGRKSCSIVLVRSKNLLIECLMKSCAVAW